MQTATKRTLIIKKPDLNNFERYKIDNQNIIQNIEDTPAFHKFMTTNPLPYYKVKKTIKIRKGGSFFSDFVDGFKKGFTTTLDIGSKVLPLIGLGGEMPCDMEVMPKKKGGRKKKVMESSSEEEELAHEKKENKKLKKIKKVVQEMQEENKKMIKGKGSKAARGELVRKLMKEKKMTLGQASKHIKDNKLI
jgi:hypothetical protein